MKVLSVKNPYGYLICHGVKDIENRSWTTKYRGDLLIHASGNNLFYVEEHELPNEILIEYDNYFEAHDSGKVYKTNNFQCQRLFDLEDNFSMPYEAKNIPYFQKGFIIGKVVLKDVVRDSQSIWADPDCFHWILEDPVLFETPIIQKGKLGLWEYTGKL